MTNQPRLIVPGATHHVRIDGHGGMVVFCHDDDFQEYLARFGTLLEKYEGSLHGWVLLPTEVHLVLAAPLDGEHALSHLISGLNSQYTRYYNGIHQGAGSVWGSRFKASPVQPGNWAMRLVRHLEWLPVSRGLTDDPAKYLWSSYQQRMGIVKRDILARGWKLIGITGTEAECRRQYRDKFAAGCAPSDCEFIENSVGRNRVTGDDQFKRQLERKLGRKLPNRGPGRPPADPD